MNARGRKVWGDLRESPGQTLLVILAILVGTAAVTTAFGARAILFREVAASFAGTHPAAAVVFLDRVEAGLVTQVRTRPGVAEAEARRLVRARVEVAPGEWLPLRLFGVANFHDLRVSTFHPHAGDWPPRLGEMLVEQSALEVLKVREGGTLRVRCPGGKVSVVRVGGVVHDPGQAPGWQDQVGYTYVSTGTLEALGEGGFLDELHLTATGSPNGNGRERAARMAADVAGWLTDQGEAVRRVEVPLGTHPHADHMRTMVTLLGVFGLLALGLSGVLAANVLAAMLARHTRQIGVLKAVGATSGQVAGIYLALALVLAGAGVALGLPLGVALGRCFARAVAPMLNLEVTGWAIPAGTLAGVAALGLGVPLLAAAVPVLRTVSGLTAREALQHAGVAPVPARGRGSRLLGMLPFVDRRVLLAFGNTFRRPVRLWLTLGALALGGALLLTAVNVHRGLVLALDTALGARGDDVNVRLLKPAPAGALVERALALPGVVAAEAWGVALVSVELPSPSGKPADGLSTGVGYAVGTDRFSLLAPPAAGTRLLRLPLTAGRWPEPHERDAVVVNAQLLAREPRLALGVAVTLRAGPHHGPVRIVGVASEVGVPALYANPPTFEAITGVGEDLAGGLRLRTAPGEQARVAAALEESLVSAGSFPVFLMTRENLRRALSDHFVIILLLLGGAALASVAVGGLGLATSMSLNVLERGREIGVLRALGASRRDVLGILALEGATLAVLSVIGAVKLSVPLSLAVGWVVGRVGLHAPVPLVISPGAIAGWVVLTTLVTAAACFFPARRALRLSVRETLAHE